MSYSHKTKGIIKYDDDKVVIIVAGIPNVSEIHVMWRSEHRNVFFTWGWLDGSSVDLEFTEENSKYAVSHKSIEAEAILRWYGSPNSTLL